MMHSHAFAIAHVGALCVATLSWAAPQEAPVSPTTRTSTVKALPTAPGYVLGAGDVIAIRALDADEITSASLRIDPTGQISLPLLGRFTAAGLSVEALERDVANRLKTYVRDPVVAVSIVEYRSQPVSVIGAVGTPGVHQLEGRRTLVEVLATAGGLRTEAGNVVKITRQATWGPIPLPSATTDATGQFTVAEVNVSNIMRATNPEENILILPNDVISVPRAELVYVLGEVRKPGGFTLNERRTVTVLQALAMAEGFTPVAVPQRAMIIRPSPDGKRSEIAVNLKDMLTGKKTDVELLPEDILLVPNSAARSALRSAAQTALSAATAAIVYTGLF